MQNRNQFINSIIWDISYKTDLYFQTKFHALSLKPESYIFLDFARIPHPSFQSLIMFEKYPVRKVKKSDQFLTLVDDLKDHHTRLIQVRSYLVDMSNKLNYYSDFEFLVCNFVDTGDIPLEMNHYLFWKAYNKQKLLNQLWS